MPTFGFIKIGRAGPALLALALAAVVASAALVPAFPAPGTADAAGAPYSVTLDGGTPWVSSQPGLPAAGGSQAAVNPGDTISVTVQAALLPGQLGDWDYWGATRWRINNFGATTIGCQDHASHAGPGQPSETFNITAPMMPGTYDLTIRLRPNCQALDFLNGVILDSFFPPVVVPGAIKVIGPTGTISVTKVFDPAPASPEAQAAFQLGLGFIPVAQLMLGDGETSDPVELAAGSEYALVEGGAPGYVLDSIECTGTDAANITPIEQGVLIALADGDTVNCVFTNIGAGDLAIQKTHAGTLKQGTAFEWRLAVTNAGAATATIPDGTVVLADDVPAGASYPSGDYTATGVTSGDLACGGIDADTIGCIADGDLVMPPGSSFVVTLNVIPAAAGELQNPRQGGFCGLFPNNDAPAGDSPVNNVCNVDKVTIAAAPAPTPVATVSRLAVVAHGGTLPAPPVIPTVPPIIPSAVIPNPGPAAPSTPSGQPQAPDTEPDGPCGAKNGVIVTPNSAWQSSLNAFVAQNCVIGSANGFSASAGGEMTGAQVAEALASTSGRSVRIVWYLRAGLWSFYFTENPGLSTMAPISARVAAMFTVLA